MANHRVDYLTTTQEQILRCIRESIAERGEAPTVREIGVFVGLRSRSSVHYHLGRIEALGYIAREPHRPRGIRLT
ncbi:LexA family protein [Streptomyces griseorubiginosus]|uniref:LexA family protein n=1 Tax=Streptomyces griseorubiginosus TaxID=67304 RepID=UPI00363DD956